MSYVIDNITDADRKIFKMIESLRESIKNKNLKVEFLDFGAGDPVDTRDELTMSNGVKTTRYTQQLCQIGLKGEWIEIIYSLVKKYKPENILELGTCCGFSSIYMSKANKESNIYTIEGACEIANIAKQNIREAECENINQIIGKFDDVLLSTLNVIQKIDFVFIDGHHDKNATLKYFKTIKPYLNDGAMVVFDDIDWSDGMKKCWIEITKDSDMKKYDDLEKLGICYL